MNLNIHQYMDYNQWGKPFEKQCVLLVYFTVKNTVHL